MAYGWTAPVIPILERNETSVRISSEDHIWLESIFLIGGLAGLPVTIYCVENIGRKHTILLSAVNSFISWILIAMANNVAYLYIARFMIGLSSDINFVAGPMYIAEIAEPKIRGFFSGLIYVMMLLGVLVIYSVAPFVAFYVPSIIGSTVLCIQLVTFPFMPDSPYYLLSKGRKDEAKNHLERLRTNKNVEVEFEEISKAVERQKSERGKPQDLILDKGNRKGIVILIVLNAAQHFSSISVVLMNLHEILLQADSIYLNANLSGIVFSALMLIASVSADIVVDKFGRKILLLISSLLSGTCLLVLAIYFSLQKNNVNVSIVSWIPLCALMVYAFCFKLGLGIVPIVMTAELFPAKMKALGMTLSDFSYVLFGWLSIEVYQRLIAVAGYDCPFYIFSACCFSVAVFSKMYIPETKGKTLEEIQFMLKGIPSQQRNEHHNS